MDIKIYSDELNAAMSFTTFDDLATDGSEATTMAHNLTEFITNSSSKLQGEQWNAAYNKLAEYNELLNKRITLANSLGAAIKEALTLLINYMEDYPSLDYSKYDEIVRTKKDCERTISNIRSIMYAYDWIDTVNDEGETIKKKVPRYTSAQIAEFDARITELEASVEELKELIAKLDGLAEVYNKAQGILDEAFSQIESLSGEVNAIKPTPRYTYVPAA